MGEADEGFTLGYREGRNPQPLDFDSADDPRLLPELPVGDWHWTGRLGYGVDRVHHLTHHAVLLWGGLM